MGWGSGLNKRESEYPHSLLFASWLWTQGEQLPQAPALMISSPWWTGLYLGTENQDKPSEAVCIRYFVKSNHWDYSCFSSTVGTDLSTASQRKGPASMGSSRVGLFSCEPTVHGDWPTFGRKPGTKGTGCSATSSSMFYCNQNPLVMWRRDGTGHKA